MPSLSNNLLPLIKEFQYLELSGSKHEHPIASLEGWQKHRSCCFWVSRGGVGFENVHFPRVPRRRCCGWSGATLRTAAWDFTEPDTRSHSRCLWERTQCLSFLESAIRLCCCLIPATHNSISGFNNDRRKQRCILLRKMLPPSHKCLMPQHLNCALIFPFIKNSIKLLDVFVAAWRGGRHSRYSGNHRACKQWAFQCA